MEVLYLWVEFPYNSHHSSSEWMFLMQELKSKGLDSWLLNISSGDSIQQPVPQNTTREGRDAREINTYLSKIGCFTTTTSIRDGITHLLARKTQTSCLQHARHHLLKCQWCFLLSFRNSCQQGLNWHKRTKWVSAVDLPFWINCIAVSCNMTQTLLHQISPSLWATVIVNNDLVWNLYIYRNIILLKPIQ